MANVNAPWGLRPIGVAKGNMDAIPILSTNATAINQFDAVAQAADGSLGVTATPGTTLYSGIALDSRGSSALEDGKMITVIVNPDIVFAAQASAAFAAVDHGLNSNLVLTAGDLVLRTSKHAVNSAVQDVTATLDVHLRRLCPLMGHSEYGNYAGIECSWNKHRQMGAAAGL